MNLAGKAINVSWFGAMQDLHRRRQARLPMLDAIDLGRTSASDETSYAPAVDFGPVGKGCLCANVAVMRKEVAKDIVVVVKLHQLLSDHR